MIAKAGRFVTKDPIGFAGGDENSSVYVKNNPLIYNDPKGIARIGERPLDLDQIPFFLFFIKFIDGWGPVYHLQQSFYNGENVYFSQMVYVKTLATQLWSMVLRGIQDITMTIACAWL